MADADLSHHYKVLKQFLDISDDSNSRAKSNSSRAARAREKLLRLSGAQFRELSTDVYDELRRRIDESRSEPDFLLPKSTFHPKRNQARQKLSSLPQSRFKDLVSDISFEIERRNLHSPVATSAPPESPSHAPLYPDFSAQKTHSHSRSQSTDINHREMAPVSPASPPKRISLASQEYPLGTPREADARHSVVSASTVDTSHFGANAAHSALQDDLATPDLRNPVSEQAIGIQPTTVVPVKANMTWSSDEEAEDGELNDARKSGHEEPRQLNLANAFPAPRLENPQGNPSANALGHPQGNSQGNDAPADQFEGDRTIEKPSVAHDEHEKLKISYENLRNEHESLIAAYTDANKQLQELTSSHQTAQRDLSSLNEQHSDVLSKHGHMETLVQQLTRDNENLASRQTSMPAPEEIQALKDELEELKNANASLRLENQSLKSSSPKSKNIEASSREVQPQIAQRGPSETPQMVQRGPSETNPVEINAELQKLHERLEQIPGDASQHQFSQKEAKLKSEISQWQKKYEALRAGELYDSSKRRTDMDLAKYRSPEGLISYRKAVELFASIDLFYAALDISNPDTDLLFDKISSIAIAANKIASEGNKNGFNDNGHVDAIRESASHALTATRYYVVYPTLMPKVIVERAVSEIAFAVCDSISALKLGYVSGNEPSEVANASVSSKSRDIPDEEINVKPLRIPQKMQPSSSRVVPDEHHSGALTPENQITGSGHSAAETSQFSPIQSKPKGESSPTPNRGYVQYASQVPAADSKPLTDKLSFKNLLGGGRAEDQVNPPVSNRAVSDAPSNRAMDNSSLNAASEKLERPATEVNTQSTDESTTRSFVENKTPAKSTTPSILDKVRKFESKSAVTSPISTEKPVVSKSVESKSASFSEVDRTPQAQEKMRSAPTSAESVPARNKSIFQSLRERFTSDNTVKPPVDSNGIVSSDPEAKENENPETEDSFEEISTPTKSKPSQSESSHINFANPSNFSQMSRTAIPGQFVAIPNEPVKAEDAQTNQPFPSSSRDLEPLSKGAELNHVVAKPQSSESNKSVFVNPTSPASSPSEKSKTPTKNDAESSHLSTPSTAAMPSVSTGEDPTISATDQHFTSASDRSIPSPSENPDVQNSNKSLGSTSVNIDTDNQKFIMPQNVGVVHSFGEESVSTNEDPARSTDRQPTETLNKRNVSSAGDQPFVPSANKPPLSNDDGHVSSEGTRQIEPSRDQHSTATEGKVFLISNNDQAPEEELFATNENREVKSREASQPVVPSPKRAGSLENNNSRSIAANPFPTSKVPMGLKMKSPSFKVRKVNYQDAVEQQDAPQGYEDAEDDSYEEEDEVRQRQDYRKSMAAATFNFDLFDIDDPDNTVTQVLLYLEHQTVQVISTIQDLLSAIKKPDATRGELRENSVAISEVIRQMTEATNTSMNQTRNFQLREHGSWVVKSLEDCNHRMNALCKPNAEKDDMEFADRHFKQRLAGISFDIAKCTKELVKTVEEASLKEDIAHLDARLNHADDLT